MITIVIKPTIEIFALSQTNKKEKQKEKHTKLNIRTKISIN
jgi:hypothetical protein